MKQRHRLFALLSIAGLLCSLGAYGAASAVVYADWLQVKEIKYYAQKNAYLVGFDGVVTNGHDANGNACSSSAYTALRADAIGTVQTNETVGRMLQELQIARALGLRVRVWTVGCTNVNNTTTYPKAFIIQTRE